MSHTASDKNYITDGENPSLRATVTDNLDGVKSLSINIHSGSVRITDGTNTAGVIQADNQMGLVTITPGHISTLNSTSTPIASGETWTGQAEESTNHGVIQLIVKSSHDSAVGGLVVEYSPDGTNWDSSDQYSIFANVGKLYSFQPASKYYRVRYTNGATQQSYFRLQTSLKPYYVKPSSHRIADLISEEDDAELVKAVLTAEMPNNTFTPINATAGGNLKVAVEEIEPGTPLDTIIANQTNGTQVVKGNVTPTDGSVDPTNAVNSVSLSHAWRSAGWRRLATILNNTDATPVATTAENLRTASFLYYYDGTNFPRARGDATYGLDVDVTRLPKSATPALTSVAGSATSVTIKASNTARVGLTVVNDSSSVLYLAYAATAAANAYTYRLNAYETFEMPPSMIYTGLVTGIWATATGNAYVTELT